MNLWGKFNLWLNNLKKKEFFRDGTFFHGADFAYMQKPYNHILDKFIQDAIKYDQLKLHGQYTCKVNDVEIWIGNYPYCYGTVDEMRPSRATIKELKDELLRKKLGITKEPNSIRYITG